MKAIELVGTIDEHHELHLDVPQELPPGQVRVILLLPEEDDVSSGWAHAVGKEWSAELEDRHEDLYTIQDGEPFVDPSEGTSVRWVAGRGWVKNS